MKTITQLEQEIAAKDRLIEKLKRQLTLALEAVSEERKPQILAVAK